MKVNCFYILLLILFSTNVVGQQKATINGKVLTQEGQPISRANIRVLGTEKGTISDEKGRFSLEIDAGKNLLIELTHVGYFSKTLDLNLKAGQNKKMNIKLSIREIGEVVVKRDYIGNMEALEPIEISKIASSGGHIEHMLATQALGTRVNNELSSGYSVRGGNFDENLIYVNDIEIYRPFLARAGQQEGLSFINSSLIENINFSAGGFEARYGDKMSSALDIKYRKPSDFKGSVTASMLGGSIHLEGATKNRRLTHLTGFRYRTNQYLLGSLQTKGDYRPSFMDFQSLITYDIRENFELSFLGHYSNNKFRFVPENRETSFGSIQQALKFNVFFDGQEVTQFETFTGALSAKLNPNENTELKFIASAFRTFESENFDVLGQYWLDEIEIDIGSEDFGETKFNLGVGTFLEHARNELNATVLNINHKGFSERKNGIIHWGVKVQKEIINDKISEWNMLDSAGFSIPNNTNLLGYNAPIELSSSLKTKAQLNSNRLSGYLQNTWSINRNKNVTLQDTSFYSVSGINLTVGARANYWSLNNETVISPRARISFKPHWNVMKKDSLIKRNILLRFSTGFYYQPPFYREIRGLDGTLNLNTKAQQSIHFVLGGDYYFKMWNRPFKLVTEAYYKQINNLNPYEIDNVRIRYYANNNAKGYAAGIDLKINGEFVKGVESWLTLSYLKTEEDIADDFYFLYRNENGERVFPETASTPPVDTTLVHPGFIPRPTDQRIGLGLFFQDRMPKWPTYRVNLNLLVGSRLPYGPPSIERFKDTLRSSLYRRVDVGFSKELFVNKDKFKDKKILKHFDESWVSLEVFNLLNISNTINYLWIKDIFGRQYPIPNFLTSRRVNLKLSISF